MTRVCMDFSRKIWHGQVFCKGEIDNKAFGGSGYTSPTCLASHQDQDFYVKGPPVGASIGPGISRGNTVAKSRMPPAFHGKKGTTSAEQTGPS